MHRPFPKCVRCTGHCPSAEIARDLSLQHAAISPRTPPRSHRHRSPADDSFSPFRPTAYRADGAQRTRYGSPAVSAAAAPGDRVPATVARAPRTSSQLDPRCQQRRRRCLRGDSLLRVSPAFLARKAAVVAAPTRALTPRSPGSCGGLSPTRRNNPALRTRCACWTSTRSDAGRSPS